MKAGRELDALIAEKVMGLTRHDESYVAEGVGKVLRFVWRDGCGTCVYSGDMFLPRYSTNIADAWEVVRKMGMVLIENSGEAFGKLDEWNVQFVGHDKEGEPHWVSESAETVELAICLAALKAKGVTGEQHG